MRKYTIGDIDALRAVITRRLRSSGANIPALQRLFLAEAMVQTMVVAGIMPEEFGKDPEPETAPEEEKAVGP